MTFDHDRRASFIAQGNGFQNLLPATAEAGSRPPFIATAIDNLPSIFV